MKKPYDAVVVGAGMIGAAVACALAMGKTLEAARANAYEALERIDFEGLTHRSDIGLKTD